MAQGNRPSDEEIDHFAELYEDLGSARKVANEDEVDWSRATVTKWLKRRGVMGDGGGEPEEDEEPEESPEPADISAPENVVPDRESPNDVLLDVLKKDPKLKDDHIDYIKGYMEDWGTLGTSDVERILNQLNINNKRMTTGRIVQRFSETINRKLREDPQLQHEEEWAILLTKETGNPAYMNAAQTRGGGYGRGGGINGPPGTEQQAGVESGGVQPPAPQQQGGQPGGIQQPQSQPQPQQGQPQQSPMPQPSGQGVEPPTAPAAGGQTGGNSDDLSPLEEFAMEMIQDEIKGDDDPQPQPQQTKQEDGLGEVLSAIEEVEQLQEKLSDATEEEDSTEIEALIEHVDQRIAQIEQRVEDAAGSGGGSPSPAPTGGDNDMLQIIQMADKVDDPELLEQLIKMQSDPDVMEAEAKLAEAKSEAEWKQTIAESLSPEVTESAMDMVQSIFSGMAQGPPAQEQPQQAQQPQQPQPQQTQQAEAGVEVVEEQEQDEPEPEEERSAPSGSPLREQGQSEADEEAEAEAEVVESAAEEEDDDFDPDEAAERLEEEDDEVDA